MLLSIRFRSLAMLISMVLPLVMGNSPANAVVMLFNESFDTDTMNAETTYPAFTLSGSSAAASVTGGVLHLSGGSSREFTIPGYSGDVLIEGDMGASGVSPGGTRAEFRLGNVRALFHPGYPNGVFRLEGAATQSSTSMGFSPAAEVLHHFTARSHGDGTFDITIQNGDSPYQVFNANFTEVTSVGQPIGFRSLSAGTGIFDNLSVRYAADLLADPAVNSTIALSNLQQNQSVLLSDHLKLSNSGLTASVLQVTSYSLTGPDAALFDLPDFMSTDLTVGGSNNVAYDIFFQGGPGGHLYNALLTLNTNIGDFTFDLQATAVPEPSSALLLALGGMMLIRRRKRR